MEKDSDVQSEPDTPVFRSDDNEPHGSGNAEETSVSNPPPPQPVPHNEDFQQAPPGPQEPPPGFVCGFGCASGKALSGPSAEQLARAERLLAAMGDDNSNSSSKGGKKFGGGVGKVGNPPKTSFRPPTAGSKPKTASDFSIIGSNIQNDKNRDGADENQFFDDPDENQGTEPPKQLDAVTPANITLNGPIGRNRKTLFNKREASTDAGGRLKKQRKFKAPTQTRVPSGQSSGVPEYPPSPTEDEPSTNQQPPQPPSASTPSSTAKHPRQLHPNVVTPQAQTSNNPQFIYNNNNNNNVSLPNNNSTNMNPFYGQNMPHNHNQQQQQQQAEFSNQSNYGQHHYAQQTPNGGLQRRSSLGTPPSPPPHNRSGSPPPFQQQLQPQQQPQFNNNYNNQPPPTNVQPQFQQQQQHFQPYKPTVAWVPPNRMNSNGMMDQQQPPQQQQQQPFNNVNMGMMPNQMGMWGNNTNQNVNVNMQQQQQQSPNNFNMNFANFNQPNYNNMGVVPINTSTSPNGGGVGYNVYNQMSMSGTNPPGNVNNGGGPINTASYGNNVQPNNYSNAPFHTGGFMNQGGLTNPQQQPPQPPQQQPPPQAQTGGPQLPTNNFVYNSTTGTYVSNNSSNYNSNSSFTSNNTFSSSPPPNNSNSGSSSPVVQLPPYSGGNSSGRMVNSVGSWTGTDGTKWEHIFGNIVVSDKNHVTVSIDDVSYPLSTIMTHFYLGVSVRTEDSDKGSTSGTPDTSNFNKSGTLCLKCSFDDGSTHTHTTAPSSSSKSKQQDLITVVFANNMVSNLLLADGCSFLAQLLHLFNNGTTLHTDEKSETTLVTPTKEGEGEQQDKTPKVTRVSTPTKTKIKRHIKRKKVVKQLSSSTKSIATTPEKVKENDGEVSEDMRSNHEENEEQQSQPGSQQKQEDETGSPSKNEEPTESSQPNNTTTPEQTRNPQEADPSTPNTQNDTVDAYKQLPNTAKQQRRRRVGISSSPIPYNHPKITTTQLTNLFPKLRSHVLQKLKRNDDSNPIDPYKNITDRLHLLTHILFNSRVVTTVELNCLTSSMPYYWDDSMTTHMESLRNLLVPQASGMPQQGKQFSPDTVWWREEEWFQFVSCVLNSLDNFLKITVQMPQKTQRVWNVGSLYRFPVNYTMAELLRPPS